jgi:hypothetical protein
MISFSLLHSFALLVFFFIHVLHAGGIQGCGLGLLLGLVGHVNGLLPHKLFSNSCLW